MSISREWVREKLHQAMKEAGEPWPPRAGRPVPLESCMENLEVNQRELSALTRRGVVRFLLDVGIEVTDIKRTQVPLSGFLFAQPGEAFAFVNRDDILTRRRFSAAHELGHFVLHFQSQLGAEENFIKADDREQLHEGEATGAALDQMEREANLFAAELLMPEEILRQRLEELGGKYRLTETFLKNQLASELLVSREAMLWRLRNLKLLPAESGGG